MGSRAWTLGTAVVAVLFAAAAWVLHAGDEPLRVATDAATGVALAAAGVVAAMRRPGSWTGLLLALAGATWFLGDFAGLPGAASTVSAALTFVHRGVLAHAIITAPTGRARGARSLTGVVLAYTIAAVPVVWSTPAVAAVAAGTFAGAMTVAAVTAQPRVRRARWLAAAAAGLCAMGIVVAAAIRAVQPAPAATALGLVIYEACVVAAAVAVVAATVVRQPGTADAVLRMADAPGQTLQDALAWAVGDARLRLGGPSSSLRFIGPDGRVVDDAAPGREVLVIRDGGTPIALLDVAADALDAPGLTDALDAAVRLAARNSSLQVRVREQMKEVEASRRRLVSAADDEERRLEERLARGVGGRLERIAETLDRLDEEPEGTDSAELRDLASALADVQSLVDRLRTGLYPERLERDGLLGALEAVTVRFPIPVRLCVDPVEIAREQAVTVYFAVTEALANAAKHASATHIDVSVSAADSIVVTVRDDGVGGADEHDGLGALRDRIAAHHGMLSVVSPPAGGTTLRIALPTGTAEP